MPRASIVPLLLVLLAAPAIAGSATVEKHEMIVKIEPDSHGISVRDRMTVRGDVLRFELASGLTIDGFLVNGHRPEGIGLSATARPDAPVRYELALRGPGPHSVVLRYSGTIHDPVKKATDAAFVVGDRTTGEICADGVFLAPETRWYPVVEGAMPRFDLEVRVPDGWRTVTQGKLVSEKTRRGRSVSTWEANLPSDGLHLQAGKFHVTRRRHGKVTLGVALRGEDPATAKLLLDELARYLEIYQPLLGPYPHPRFDVVENFFTSGYGMPGYTLLGGDVIRVMRMLARGSGRIRPGFLDHELMHGWWGNGVYLDFEKGNWCEGLTTYCTNYYRKELEDPEAAITHRRRVLQAYSIKVSPETDYPVRKFTGKTEDVDNDVGYGKSSMIFHMLRREIGDEAFWQALRDLATAFAGRKAGWADLEAAFEEASGRRLDGFFATWLDRKGGPVLVLEDAGFDAMDGPLVQAVGVIAQRGEELWPLRVEVVLRDAADDRALARRSLPIARERTRFAFPIPEELAGRSPAELELALDPDAHLFRRLPAPAVPACLRAVLEDPAKVVVYAEAEDDAYRIMADRAVADKGGDVRPAPAAGDVADRSLMLLGAPWTNPETARMLEAWGGPVEIGRESITIEGEFHEGPGLSLLLSFRRPDAPGKFVTIYLDLDRGALRRPPRPMFYGWDGYVLFEGGRAVARGSLESVDDPAVKPLAAPSGAAEPAPEERPAAEAPETEAARALLEELGAPELRGRGAGTPGARRAEELVARELYRAGLRVRRDPFSFEVLDFRGGDLRVDAGGRVKILRDAFVPFPDCRETDGPVTTTFGELREAGGEVVPWPAADDRRGWSALVYPSRLPAPIAAGFAKARAAGEPANVWRLASGAQARVLDAARRSPTSLRLAVDPRILEGLGDDTPVTFEVSFSARTVEGANVLGVLPGRDPAAPAIVVGAHFDGLGADGDRVFPCADDNLSGVTAMLLAARALAAGERLDRTVVFLGFDAEEWGLRGSTHHVRGVDLAGTATAAMVNLDTVGRRDVRDVYVIGRSEHPELAKLAIEELERAGFGTGKDIDRYAFPHGSDHWPFHEAGIPAIDLWSSDYRVMNSSRDVPEDVSAEKVTRIADALTALVRRLAG